MSLDRQRIAAMKTLEEAGWTWDGSGWRPAESSPNGNLRAAIAFLVVLHTDGDEKTVSGTSMWRRVEDGWRSEERYVEAWGVLRRHLGLTT